MKPGQAYRLDNLLSRKDIATLNKLIDELPEYRLSVKDQYGRRMFEEIEIPRRMAKRITKIANRFSEEPLELLYAVTGAEYSVAYNGNPNLPPHFDGDFNDIIIDYQLDSNTQWPLGVNLETYPLTDNSGVIFNPNTNIHWRPHKTFKDGEYVRMIFFRFYNPVNKSDYSYLPNHPDNPAFAKVRAYRDSLAD